MRGIDSDWLVTDRDRYPALQKPVVDHLEAIAQLAGGGPRPGDCDRSATPARFEGGPDRARGSIRGGRGPAQTSSGVARERSSSPKIEAGGRSRSVDHRSRSRAGVDLDRSITDRDRPRVSIAIGRSPIQSRHRGGFIDTSVRSSSSWTPVPPGESESVFGTRSGAQPTTIAASAVSSSCTAWSRAPSL
jgi:hypothetical protein